MAIIEDKYPVAHLLTTLPSDGKRCPFVWYHEYRCVRPVAHQGGCLIERDGQDIVVLPWSSRFAGTIEEEIPSIWRVLRMRIDPSVG